MAQFIKTESSDGVKTFINLDNVLCIDKEAHSKCRVYFVDGSVRDIKQSFDTLDSSNKPVIPLFKY